jgi:hypothetical protein
MRRAAYGEESCIALCYTGTEFSEAMNLHFLVALGKNYKLAHG